MDPRISTILSLIFLIIGAAAVYCMMAKLGRKELDHPERYTRLHKWFGWLFVVLFLVLFISMLERIENYYEESSPRITFHIVLSVALFLLILVKVSIPRFFRMLGKHLFLLGIVVYLTAFTLVVITAGYYIIWKYKEEPYISHAEIPEHMKDIDLGKELFIVKCSTCHLLKNIMQPRSLESWEKIVNEMVKIAEPRITIAEANQILHYLSATHTPEKISLPSSASLLEKHCLPCHSAKEIWSHSYSRSGWREIVKKMNEYDPEIVPLEKIEALVDFLIKNQNRE
jgi:hypothetical protein